VAGFELNWGGTVLLVDPFLTRPPVYKLLFGRTRPDGELLRQYLPQADFILVSHAHYDHLLDVAEIAGYTGARVYGSANTYRILAVCGLEAAQVVRVRAGEVLTLTPSPSPLQGEGSETYPQPLPAGMGVDSLPVRGELEGGLLTLPPDRGELEGGGVAFTLTTLPGQHAPIPFARQGRLPARLTYPLRLRDFVLDEDFGFLIRAEAIRLLAWHNWRPTPAPRADVLVIGADIHLLELGELLDQVQPHLLIPTHWDNFLRPLSKPLKPFFRPPCPGHPLPERYDPHVVQRWVSRHRPGIEVWVPGLMERINL
jgi:hypothetical protein